MKIRRTLLQGRENCECKGPETAASLSYKVREVNWDVTAGIKNEREWWFSPGY